MAWARLLLLFEAFASGLPRSDFETQVFFAGGNLFVSLFFECEISKDSKEVNKLFFAVNAASRSATSSLHVPSRGGAGFSIGFRVVAFDLAVGAC